MGLSFGCLNSDGTPTAGMLCDRNGDSAPLPVHKSPFFALSIKTSPTGDGGVSWHRRDATGNVCVALQAGQQWWGKSRD